MDPQIALERRAQVEDFQRRHRSKLVTMLFSDVVGSTKLKQILGDSLAIDLLDRHNAIVREILARFPEGEEIHTAGDAFFITSSNSFMAAAKSPLTWAATKALAIAVRSAGLASPPPKAGSAARARTISAREVLMIGFPIVT